jgi:hypothetical protein
LNIRLLRLQLRLRLVKLQQMKLQLKWQLQRLNMLPHFLLH